MLSSHARCIWANCPFSSIWFRFAWFSWSINDLNCCFNYRCFRNLGTAYFLRILNVGRLKFVNGNGNSDIRYSMRLLHDLQGERIQWAYLPSNSIRFAFESRSSRALKIVINLTHCFFPPHPSWEPEKDSKDNFFTWNKWIGRILDIMHSTAPTFRTLLHSHAFSVCRFP